MGMRKITISPRVLQHLGKDLITSPDVAVIELVKNSIDAKAKEIKIRLFDEFKPANEIPEEVIGELVSLEYKKLPLLIVEDCGVGMTDAILEDAFLNVGTDHKVNDEEMLGEKGIGRLAAQRLGKALLIETSSELENHTSYTFLDWDEIIKGNESVPSVNGPDTPAHTKLWIFGINLDDFIENSYMLSQKSLFDVAPDIILDRDLRSALNFMISPFSNEAHDKFPSIKLYYNNSLINTGFPQEKLKLAESIHSFVLENDEEGIALDYRLDIKPWFAERVHRAMVGPNVFNRVKKDHEFYADMLARNKDRINAALAFRLSKAQLTQQVAGILGDMNSGSKEQKSEEVFLDYISSKAEKVCDELSEIAPVSGSIFSFKQGAAIGEKIIIDAAEKLGYTERRYSRDEVKQFLEDYNGVKLYRGNYRIGFLGNKESDWIRLQQFRTKGQQWYRFDLGNTVGYTSVTDPGQKKIKEISSRLDISENEASEAFKLLITIVFNHLFYELNRKANDLMGLFLKEEGLIEESLGRTVDENKKLINELTARNKRMQKAIKALAERLENDVKFKEDAASLPLRTFDYLSSTISSMEKDIHDEHDSQQKVNLFIKEADDHLKAIEIEAYNNYKLMANGLITETITHELHSISRTSMPSSIENHFDYLSDYLTDKGMVKLYNDHVYPIQDSYQVITGKLLHIGDLYSFLEKTFIHKGAHDSLEYQNISEIVENTRLNLLNSRSIKNVDVRCVAEDVTWLAPKGVMLHIFYNLIDNSLYWIDKGRERAQIDEGYGNIHDEMVIETYGEGDLVFYDNGPGVSREMEDLLFEPLESGKPFAEKRGMGLYIVKKLLNSFGGDIELMSERNRHNNRYKFLLTRDSDGE